MDLSFAAKRLWHMIRAAYYALRKGFSKHRLIMDLHLLLSRSKIAGKSIAKLLTSHHISPQPHAAFSFHNPTDVEFSCSNTPYYSLFPSAKRNRRHPLDAAALTKALEMLSPEYDARSPSPAPLRQLEITDSEGPEADGVSHVDREAEEFIRRFYEQLCLQRSVSATPEYQLCRRRTPE